MGKRGPKPKCKTSTKWSPKLAYAVGLIASDGNLSSSGRHINLTSKDKEQIDTFQKCIGREITVSKKISTYTKRKDYYHAQFGDVAFYKWLESLGLTTNKSKTLSSLSIPDKYFFDFLRGVWDGDGCIYSYFDPRWKSSYMYYISFVSGSSDFIEWLQTSCQRLIGTKGHVTVGGRGTKQLKFAKKDTQVLFSAMFHSKSLPHLSRKFAKANKIFTLDKANNAKRLKS